MAITLKKLSGDTEVIANPTLDGSETALSGLQIDGVKYAMGGGSSGGSLYEHNLRVTCSTSSDYSNVVIFLKLYTNSATTIKTNDVYNYIKDNFNTKKTTEHYYLDVIGYVKTSTGTYYNALYIYFSNGPSSMYLIVNNGTQLLSVYAYPSSVIDKVMQIL